MEQMEVVIYCPKCKKQALYRAKASYNNSYVPERIGTVTCVHCGFTGKHSFSNTDYYFQIPVGNKVVYARNIKNFILIKEWFDTGFTKPHGDPNSDFPKYFYTRREEIIRKINTRLQQEIGNTL